MHSLSKVVTCITLLIVAWAAEASGDVCSSRFVDNINRNKTQQLVRVIGRSEPTFGSEQWVFPHLQFNCHRILTKWIFKGMGHINAQCKVQLGTWGQYMYRYASPSLSPVYKRISTTDGNTARISVDDDGSTFTYELANPVQVHPGEFVGAEMTCSSSTEQSNRLNLLGLRNSGDGSVSYRRFGSALPLFDTAACFHENDLLPFIQVVMGMPEEPVQELESITTERDQIDYDIVTATNAPGPTDSEETSRNTELVNNYIRNNHSFTTTEVKTNHNSGGISETTVIIIAAISGGLIALIVTVTVMCVSAIIMKRLNCCTRSKQDVEQSSNCACDEERRVFTTSILLENNYAYNKSGLTQEIEESNVAVKLQATGTPVSQSDGYEEIDTDSEGYETASIQLTTKSSTNYEVTSMRSEHGYETIRSDTECLNFKLVDCEAYDMIDTAGKLREMSEKESFETNNQISGTTSNTNHDDDCTSLKLSMNIAYVDNKDMTIGFYKEKVAEDPF